MAVHVTYKNVEDPIKNEDARVATALHIDFSYVQNNYMGISGSATIK